jgi:hypothetical protein
MNSYKVQIVYLVNGKPLMETIPILAADKRNAYFQACQVTVNAGARILDAYVTDLVAIAGTRSCEAMPIN